MIIAYNEGRAALHAGIKVRWNDHMGTSSIVDTTVGRVLFNEVVPSEAGYVNDCSPRRASGQSSLTFCWPWAFRARFSSWTTSRSLGFTMAYKGGLSFNLNDIIIPKEKVELVDRPTIAWAR